METVVASGMPGLKMKEWLAGTSALTLALSPKRGDDHGSSLV
jgi:hypothetical protein